MGSASSGRLRGAAPLLLVVLLLTACTSVPSPRPTASATGRGWAAELTVTASGADTADIAVQVIGAPARTVRASSATLPWTQRFTTAAAARGASAAWTVSVPAPSSGAVVTCRIRIDGVVAAEQRSAASGRGVVCHAVRPA